MMRTDIILGPQGSGKSTLAATLRALYWGQEPVIAIEPQRGVDTQDVALALRALAMEGQEKPHNLLIDEADVFFSLLSPRERKEFGRYWAVARHMGLRNALFIARRLIQIPIFVRASVSQIHLSARTRDVRTVKSVQELGGEASVQSLLPEEIARKGYYFQLCLD